MTGEAGLNDGAAFPFVMLGLGLMGTHPIGAYGWRWLTVDLTWAVAAGLGVGTLCGAVPCGTTFGLPKRPMGAPGS